MLATPQYLCGDARGALLFADTGAPCKSASSSGTVPREYLFLGDPNGLYADAFAR